MSEAIGAQKCHLLLRADDFTLTARELAKAIAASGHIFDRAGPVQLASSPDGGAPRILRLCPDSVVILAHKLIRPVARNADGSHTAKTLPDRVARLYLALGEWGLRPLRGVATTPLLFDDGSFDTTSGYDPASGLWCAPTVEATVLPNPSVDDARNALAVLRRSFSTFPFADARTVVVGALRYIDISHPPGQDESALLVALLGAICRPSLPLGPGLLMSAPSISGAGTGKGILVRAVSLIAFGIQPRAFTVGPDTAELDKRIASALIEATQMIMIDNANGALLRSDLLASILTERSIDVRPLGSSRMLPLAPNAFVAVTGNGVILSEDLARRFVVVQLDARTEDPEARPFPPGFLRGIEQRRGELLSAALTIWRWGRLNENTLPYGRPMGSFEEWARWVRDPLLALGCADPAERIRSIKRSDPVRRNIVEIFKRWWEHHADRPVKAAELAPEVRELIDPQGRGRQYIASFLAKHVGTGVNGLVMTAQPAIGKWGATSYALRRLDPP